MYSGISSGKVLNGELLHAICNMSRRVGSGEKSLRNSL